MFWGLFFGFGFGFGLVCFDLVWFCESWWICVSFILLHVNIQFSLYQFSPVNIFDIYVEYKWLKLHALIFMLSILLHWFAYLFLCQCNVFLWLMIHFEIWIGNLSSVVLLAQHCFGISVVFYVSIWLLG